MSQSLPQLSMSQLKTLRQKKIEDEKLPFVKLIAENKKVLFGKFSNEITKDAKKTTWKSIADQLKALGIQLIPDGKDWTYLRDTVWRNCVYTTKKRFDDKCKTGAGRIELTPLDNMVLEVLGKDSAGIKVGLNQS